MTKEQTYDALISPLMTQIIALSKEHDIPMVAAFDLDDDRDDVDGRPGLARITAQVPKNAARRFHDAVSALHPRPLFAAFTIIERP